MKKKKVLSLALSVAMIFAMFTPVTASADQQFADMPNDWSTAALQNAVDNGIINGFDVDGKMYIRAKAPLTRAQMATIINNAFNTSATASLSGVSDVRSSDWFYDQMAKAVQMGSFAKASNMRPNDNITREEAFTVLAKVFKLPEASSYRLLNGYDDAGKVSDYAKSRMEALLENGYISGSNNMLRPKANITRAEFATLMDNVVKQYFNSTGSYASVRTGNVLISVPNVTLKSVTVNGDLIIADGVGKGNVSLDGVRVTGRVVVRGGGPNSIEISGSSNIKEIYVDNPNNQVRIYASNNSSVSRLYASGDVILDGTYSNVDVIGDDTNININGTVDAMTVEAAATVSVVKNAVLKQVSVQSAADGTVIKGEGDVEKASVYANNTQVNTNSTKITVGSGVKNVSSGNSWIDAGSTFTSDKDASKQTPPTEKGSAVTGVSLNTTNMAILTGSTSSSERKTLKATITPSGAADKEVKWTISGTNSDRFELYDSLTKGKVVKEDEWTDLLTVYVAVKDGKTLAVNQTATVKVTTSNGNKSDTCKITVTDSTKTAMPKVSNASVAKTAATQKSVTFTLTNDPKLSGTWKVYSGASGATLASGVTASNNGATLTLTHGTDIPAATYYVTVTESGKTESDRLALTVSAYGTAYTIKGTILGEGTPGVLPATLQLKNSSGNNVGSAVTANSEGIYTISGVLAGSGYTISVSYGGYVTGTISSFKVDGNLTNVNLTLQKTRYSIEGLVYDSDTKAGLDATLQLKDSSGNPVGSAVPANTNGIYKISNVLPGTYTIAVTRNGYDAGAINNIVVVSSNLDTKNCPLVKTAVPTYTYSATISPGSETFSEETVGYVQPGAKEFTIRNTGTGEITGLSAALGGSDFVISANLSSTTIAAGGTATVSVQPKANLPASENEYTGTLTITGNNGISLSVDLSFKVSASE